jgi:Glycosyltransferases, probably involved in cell wall biogenesis
MSRLGKIILSLTVAAGIASILLYLMARTVLFFLAPVLWYEKSLAAFLLLAEAFTMVHALGYFLNIRHVIAAPDRPRFSMDNVPELTTYPPVAIIVSSFKEPLEVIEATLTCFYNLTYPNKHIYFLDDTRYDLPGQDPQLMASYRHSVDDLCRRIGVNLFRRKWRGAKAGMVNDFLDFLAGRPKAGFEFTPFEDIPRRETEKYVILFDADMNPLPDFVEPLVAFMEANPRLAFIQTPQYYSNFLTNRVARAAGLQQAVFYEYICEGKSIQDAMFCCGTNVIFRREALESVGGFDESSVTEDFATSLKFHITGWSSAYLNKVCAFGLGPEDLGGYFRQQFRWALGTVGLLRTILGTFLRGPGRLPAAKWWEYFLSGSHYFVGWVLFIMMLCPVLYLITGVPSFFARPELYLLFFLPYVVLTLVLFVYTMTQRRYRFKELAVGIILQALTFPVYMKASLLGILGYRGTFKTTPKGSSKALPLYALWIQVGMAAACAFALAFGGMRLLNGDGPVSALLANGVWTFYHLGLLSTALYFNHPEEPRP